MAPYVTHIILFFSAFALSAGLTAVVLPWLKARAILDHPNERSSHVVATPRGGGLAVSAAVLGLWAGWTAWTGEMNGAMALILGGALALAAISWIDDLRTLGAGVRLLAQLGAVAVGVYVLPGDGLVFDGLVPAWADHVLVGLAWVWFVNLFNFMDGIDGISGIEAGAIAIGVTIIVITYPAFQPTALAGLAIVIAGACGGFLLFNWHPAKVFLGDVGSVPLGFLLGWLLMALAVQSDVTPGAWAPALILPAYYWVDATITLVRRALRGEKIWQAHREHYYQKAVQRGLSHDHVVKLIALGNIVLVALALEALDGALWGAVAIAGLVVALVIVKLGSDGVKGGERP